MISRLVAAALALCAAGGTASAATIYESAAYTGNDNGGYTLSADNLMGAVFTLDRAMTITGIGAQFGGYPSGSIFGAILNADASRWLPSGKASDIDTLALGHTVFSVTSGTHDQTAALPLTLNAGTYAVVFGSGHFGATGFASLGDANTPIPGSHLARAFFSSNWSRFGDAGVRMFVEGDEVAPAPVPVVASAPLLATGLAGLTALVRRRRRA